MIKAALFSGNKRLRVASVGAAVPAAHEILIEIGFTGI